MLHSPEIGEHPWWVLNEAADDRLVETADIRMGFACLLASLPDVRQTLEVGAGCGCVSLHLSGMNPALDVFGTEVSSSRVAAARLQARLEGNGAKFEQQMPSR